MIWACAASAALPPTRFPDGMVDDLAPYYPATFIDLDRDGALDIVAPTGEASQRVVTFSGAPYELPAAEHLDMQRKFVVDALAPDPTTFLFADSWLEGTSTYRKQITEYDLGPTGVPAVVWSQETDAVYFTYVGDMDGDGRSDLYMSGGPLQDFAWIRLSATGTLTDAPNEMLGRPLQTVTPIGDIDGDGYADVVLGFSTEVFTWGSGEGREYGHASMHLGGPGGLSPAQWRFEPSPTLSAGRSVVRIPGTDTLVFAVFLDREDRNGEMQSTITVMLNASHPPYTIGQRFVEPDWAGGSPTLLTQTSAAGTSLIIGSGRSGYWYQWNPALQEFDTIPIGFYDFDDCHYPVWFGRPGGPVGMRGRMGWPMTPTPLMTWGWTPQVSSTWDGMCGDVVDGTATASTDTGAVTAPSTDTGSIAPPPSPGNRCGCTSQSTHVGSFTVLILAAWCRRAKSRSLHSASQGARVHCAGTCWPPRRSWWGAARRSSRRSTPGRARG